MPQPRKQIAVIGLGRFGRSVCRTLHQQGHEVLGIDASEEETRSAQAEEIATHIVQADSTDLHALEELSLSGFDTVVIGIGTDLEVAVLTALNLVELGVSQIVAKASHEKYGKVMERVGGEAIRVVYPEMQMGERVANAISGQGIIEMIELDPDYSIIEVPASPLFFGKTLGDTGLRERYGVTVIAIKGKGGVNIAPLTGDRIHPGDILTVIGDNKRLNQLPR
ncbi:TrkA family potassium uptake protein [bacterium]|nr:TrkA family potassium uptake protein [bacterium]